MRDPRNLMILALGMACAFLGGLVVSKSSEPAWAQQAASGGAQSVSQNAGYIAATGTVGSGMSVLWLVDTEANRVVVYGTSNLGKSIELRAARNIEWDLRLDEYNDESQYKAEDLERLARRQSRKSPTKLPGTDASSNQAGEDATTPGSGGDDK